MNTSIHTKIGMRVKTLSARRLKQILRVNTASGANWLKLAQMQWNVNGIGHVFLSPRGFKKITPKKAND